jgi:hypothetical protein
VSCTPAHIAVFIAIYCQANIFISKLSGCLLKMSTLKDKYQVNNVFVSAVTPENISRQQLLAWVNSSLAVIFNH